MTKAAKRFLFEGQFENSVLGTFRIIRGFASLKDLASVSVPYEMEDGDEAGGVRGQQRSIDPLHAERIKHYLESGEQRFLPEVILSIRTQIQEEHGKASIPIGVVSTGDDGITIRRSWKSENIRVHKVTVDGGRLDEIRDRKLIRRVDGNHRLALAEQLQDDPSVPSKYLAPFCLVLLGPEGDAADDYSESLIFHTINSTALPLESEHALRLILGQDAEYDMTPEREFAYSPDLHFTRLLRDGLLKLPEPAQTRLGERPLTSLRAAVRGLLESDAGAAKDLETLRQHAADLLAALTDIVTRLEPEQPSLCKSDFFIELSARVWKDTPPGGLHTARVNESVSYLQQLASWLGKDGLLNLTDGISVSRQLLEIYAAVRTRIPRRVFLARWYPNAEDGIEAAKAGLRLAQVKQALAQVTEDEGVALELVDMGTQTGSTFPIHAKMYEAIASADIILVDLSGVRPNVCVEAGYALNQHEANRLIFMFQPNAAHAVVPFDLRTFRYESFSDTGEIAGKITPHLVSILRAAREGR